MAFGTFLALGELLPHPPLAERDSGGEAQADPEGKKTQQTTKENT
jgi:hypothetical protein